MTRISLALAILALAAFGAEAAMTNPGGNPGKGNPSAGQGDSDMGGNGEVVKPKKKGKKGDKQEFLIIKLQEILVTG